jgi:hypothetical protein
MNSWIKFISQELSAKDAKKEPNFDIIELLSVSFKKVCIILAVPSAVFRAILPVNPSVITTLVLPLKYHFPQYNQHN